MASQNSQLTLAWGYGGPDFQSHFDKFTAQAQMKEGALRVL